MTTESLSVRTPGFVEPRSLVFWLFIGLAAYGLWWHVNEDLGRWGEYPGGLLVSVVVWIVYGVVVGWILYQVQLFEHRPVSSIAAALLWGGLVAGAGSVIGGEGVHSLIAKWFGTDFANDWAPALSAPTMEEGLKILGVIALALIPRVRFSTILDGLFYGMLIGLGFTVSENITYTNVAIAATGGADIGGSMVDVIIQRGIIAIPFAHVVYTGISGAGIGYVVSRRGKPVLGRILVAIGLFALAWGFHFFNNSPIFEVGGAVILKGIPALATLLLLAWWGRTEERTRMRELGGALDDDLIDADEFEQLGSRRSRRRARRRASEAGGRAAKHAMKRLQAERIDLLVAADRYGPTAPEVAPHASAVRSAEAAASAD